MSGGINYANVLADQDFNEEVFGFKKRFTKRDITRDIPFNDWGDFRESLIKYAESLRPGQSIPIYHKIVYDTKSFIFLGEIQSNHATSLKKDKDEFLPPDDKLEGYYLTPSTKTEVGDLIEYITQHKLKKFIGKL